MACFIIGAGSFYGLPVPVRDTDTVIAADGGWRVCRELSLTPSLLVADFDSLDAVPEFDHILRLPVEKDDTDMIRAVKEGFARGETEFHLLGGMGGRRTDHTLANMQTLAYIARFSGTPYHKFLSAGTASSESKSATSSGSPPSAMAARSCFRRKRAAFCRCSVWERTRRA